MLTNALTPCGTASYPFLLKPHLTQPDFQGVSRNIKWNFPMSDSRLSSDSAFSSMSNWPRGKELQRKKTGDSTHKKQWICIRMCPCEHIKKRLRAERRTFIEGTGGATAREDLAYPPWPEKPQGNTQSRPGLQDTQDQRNRESAATSSSRPWPVFAEKRIRSSGLIP